MSSETPSVSGLSNKDTFHVQVASIPTNVPHFLTFIETSTQPVLLSIAQSHKITVPSKSALDVIRNLVSDHVSSSACLGSSLPACTNLNASLCGQDCESSNDNLNDDFQLTLDLEIHILSRLLRKLKLRPLRRILSQNSVNHDRNGNCSYLRRELKKYITRLRHGKRTEEQRNKILQLEKPAGGENQDQNQRLLESWPQLVGQNLKNKIVNMFRQQTSIQLQPFSSNAVGGEATGR